MHSIYKNCIYVFFKKSLLFKLCNVQLHVCKFLHLFSPSEQIKGSLPPPLATTLFSFQLVAIKMQSLHNPRRNNHLFIMCHFQNYIWNKLHQLLFLAVIQCYLFMEILYIISPIFCISPGIKKIPHSYIRRWIIFYGMGNKELRQGESTSSSQLWIL